jgi:ribosomal protein L37AE/L43A
MAGLSEDAKKEEELIEFHRKRNTCPKCGSTEMELRNYDMMWHDGDIHCQKCGTYVRGYDAG